MGQAKRRKAEIEQLKAAPKMLPLMRRATIIQKDQSVQVFFDLQGLNQKQQDFLRGMESTFNTESIPKILESKGSLDAAKCLCMAFWKSKDDFAGLFIDELKDGQTPDQAWRESYDDFAPRVMTNERIAIDWAEQNIPLKTEFIYADQFFAPFQNNPSAQRRIIEALELKDILVWPDLKKGAFLTYTHNKDLTIKERDGYRVGFIASKDEKEVFLLPMVKLD